MAQPRRRPQRGAPPRVTVRKNTVRLAPDIAHRVRVAIALRRRAIDLERLGAVRLVSAESDGLPGIVVDRYGDYLVVQLYTSAIAGLRDELYDGLVEALAPAAIYEQRRFRPLAGEAPRQAAA